MKLKKTKDSKDSNDSIDSKDLIFKQSKECTRFRILQKVKCFEDWIEVKKLKG